MSLTNGLHNRRHKIIAVTPAGRKRYLEILASYVLTDNTIDEWHLWDNCRTNADRSYIYQLAKGFEKIRIITEPGADGSIRSVGKFYKHTRDPNAFYIKLDDDIVYLPKNFGIEIYSKALSEKDKFSWWSPLVINNAICTYLLVAKGVIHTKSFLTAQANCPIAWGSPIFAKNLHETFLNSVEKQENWQEIWKLNENYSLFMQRFSINALGFFGDLSFQLGERFCPEGVDDEEYISAQLPLLTGKPGRLLGDIFVVHFAFHTQEDFLLERGILGRYARLAGIKGSPAPGIKNIVPQRWKKAKKFFRESIKQFLNDVLNYYTHEQKERYSVALGQKGRGE